MHKDEKEHAWHEQRPEFKDRITKGQPSVGIDYLSTKDRTE